MIPDGGRDLSRPAPPLVGSLAMGTMLTSLAAAGAATDTVVTTTWLTKRRAVDLCRVATCLCRPVA
jgi:hypothetical protein